MTKAIITSASNKFFPSLINLLGSIKANYPNHPHIYVYDLGLFYTFRKELESMPEVTLLKIPHFVPFWRSCYTWKTYILNTPLADLNFYLDAGNQVLRPLDEIFEEIERDGYFAVGQGVLLEDITPKEYKNIFNLEQNDYKTPFITAGIFGFKKDSTVSHLTENLYNLAISGLCLGFSKEESWKNKGVNKNIFVRNCKMFCHDTTLLSLVLKEGIKNLKSHDIYKFGGANSKQDHPDQIIWNLRMNYVNLDYLRPKRYINTLIVKIFILIRKIRFKFKK